MLFNTTTYLIFLPLVFACYWSMRSTKGQNWVVLLASMVFYGWWSLPFLGLMVATCLLNFLCVRRMGQTTRRKLWMATALIVNFGVLALFKYFNFFAENFAMLIELFGMKADMPTINVILPVGISFYTLQLSAYVIDCYRENLKPTASLLNFLAFIMFFPQLVAGPIERGSKLLTQMEKQRSFSYPDGVEGLRLILLGLFKKMVIADNCAVSADAIFANPTHYVSSTLAVGAVLFTFQIYGDFSGYSDIARGSAKLFGIHLSQNFRKPYLATSIIDFWRRWHITLQTWLRDYLYIPLGGSRMSQWRTQLNVSVVFVASGLWHGASWTFVLWGIYHAILFIPSRIWSHKAKSSGDMPIKNSFLKLFLPRLVTFVLVCVGLIIFRCDTVSDIADYFSTMCSLSGFCTLPVPPSATLALIGMSAALLLMVCEYLCLQKEDVTQGFDAMPKLLRRCLYVAVVLMIMVFGGDNSAFIYFQF